MNILILSGTPKHEGLTHSCVQSARDGVVKTGGDCAIVNLCEAELGCCKVCDDGWGTCRKEHFCSFGDDGFTAIQDKISVPGDSGNGMVSCFEQMERLCRHLRADIFDFVGVNRWNKEYKLATIGAAAAALVSQSRPPVR